MTNTETEAPFAADDRVAYRHDGRTGTVTAVKPVRVGASKRSQSGQSGWTVEVTLDSGDAARFSPGVLDRL